MIDPMTADLVIRRNDNPFRATFETLNEAGAVISFATGYTARLEMRLYPGADGSPLVSALSSASSGTRLLMHSAGIDLIVVKGDIPLLVGAAGKDQTIRYDLLIKPSGGDENAWYEGAVTIKPGVSA